MDFNVKIKIHTLPVYLCQCQYPGCDITILQEVTTGGSWIKDEISLHYFLQVYVNLSLPQNEKVFKKMTSVACVVFLLDCAAPKLPDSPTSPCPTLVHPGTRALPAPQYLALLAAKDPTAHQG